MNDAIPAVADLFRRQDGAASAQQLEACGMSRKMIRTRVQAGEWRQVSRDVIRSNFVAETWRTRVRVASLDAGADAAVSHATAGRLHGFDGFDRETTVHVTVCGNRHRTSLPDVIVHRSKVLRRSSCTSVDGIGVVSKAVALVQIAGTMGTDAAARALDGVLRGGASPKWLEQVLAEWLRPGVKGALEVRVLLAERVQRQLPRSWFQRLATRVLATRAVMLVDEHRVFDPATGRLLAELDLANPELLIGVECQSWEWHGSPSDQARDAARKRRLRLLGWEIVDVWWSDLRRIDDVVAEVQFLIDRRMPRLLA